MDIQTALTTVVSVFLLLLAGYAAKRVGVLKPGDSTVVNSIVINLTMPAFIFVYTHGKPITPGMVKAPMLGIVAEMAVMGLAYLCARAMRLDRRTTGALMLVSAFAGRDRVLEAYREAVAQRYRFYSYGDAMLIT